MRVRLALCVAALALASIPAVARSEDGCTWRIRQTLRSDPPRKWKMDWSALIDVIPFRYGYWWVLNRTVTFGDLVPEWAYRGEVDAGEFDIDVDCQAYSGYWGFSSVSDSLTGGGQWLIERVSVCGRPIEDIEVSVRQQFHVEAYLNADEKIEVLGALKFWCGNTRSASKPTTVRSEAAGGVSLSASHEGEPSVTVEIYGIKTTITTGDSGSDTDDPQDSDSGNRGHSPETIDTFTAASWTMALDSEDVCGGMLNQVRWRIWVEATCDGACQNRQPMMMRNDFVP